MTRDLAHLPRRPRLPAAISRQADGAMQRLIAGAIAEAREERRRLHEHGVPASLAEAEAAGWRLWTREPDGPGEAVMVVSATALRAFERVGWTRTGTAGLYVLLDEPEAVP